MNVLSFLRHPVGISFLLASLILSSWAESKRDKTFDLSPLETVLIQHEGRLKPLSSVARIYLLSFSERSSINEKSAIEWLLSLLIDPEKHDDEKVFKIRNQDVVAALGLPKRPKQYLYSFRELRDRITAMRESLHRLHMKERSKRSFIENQLVDLYVKVHVYRDLSRSFTCLIPDIRINHPDLVKSLRVTPNTAVSYSHLIHNQYFRKKLEAVTQKDEEDLTTEDKALIDLFKTIQYQKLGDQSAKRLSIIPPEELESSDEKWASPWELMDGRYLKPRQKAILTTLNQCVAAIYTQDAIKLPNTFAQFKAKVGNRSYKISLEWFYDKAKLFDISFYLYLFSFIFLLISWSFKKRYAIPHHLSISFLFIGACLHGIGIGIRILILSRPPVSTLYESIIFVAWIIVFIALFLEWKRRDSIGILLGSIAGMMLHRIGFSYAVDGNTMGTLVAVLNSNFWLATHVIVITIGYGTAFVVGTMAHVYLLVSIWKTQEKPRQEEFYKTMIWLSVLALFFTSLGTILGGIWADQSWGRFWGWDPKENGALLIVLWLILLLHGRVSGQIRAIGFAVGLVLLNVVVALAWFGVNLLNVGLHSYGFTDGVALNLVLFCGLELFFAVISGSIASYRRHRLFMKQF